jgi:hypothetical protein
MAKFTLNVAAMHEDFFADASLIGIVSAMPAYRLCWMLNKHFGVDFARNPQQNIHLQKKGTQYVFPTYQYNFPNSNYQYLLYKLKNGAETLLPEARQLDFLWLVQTADPEDDAHAISSELKNIPDIQLARLLEKAQLKSLNNLLV